MIESNLNRVLAVLLFGYQMLGLLGCSVISRNNEFPVRNTRVIRTSVKLKTPDKTVSAVLSVGILDGTLIRLDAADPFGVTHASINIDARNLEVFDLNARCRRSYSNWTSGLSNIWGVPISFAQLIGWIFPEEWPNAPVVFRVERNDHIFLEVRQFPPAPGTNARVEAEIPDRGISFIMNWMESENQKFALQSIVRRMEMWDRCDDLPTASH